MEKQQVTHGRSYRPSTRLSLPPLLWDGFIGKLGQRLDKNGKLSLKKVGEVFGLYDPSQQKSLMAKIVAESCCGHNSPQRLTAYNLLEHLLPDYPEYGAAAWYVVKTAAPDSDSTRGTTADTLKVIAKTCPWIACREMVRKLQDWEHRTMVIRHSKPIGRAATDVKKLVAHPDTTPWHPTRQPPVLSAESVYSLA